MLAGERGKIMITATSVAYVVDLKEEGEEEGETKGEDGVGGETKGEDGVEGGNLFGNPNEDHKGGRGGGVLVAGKGGKGGGAKVEGGEDVKEDDDAAVEAEEAVLDFPFFALAIDPTEVEYRWGNTVEHCDPNLVVTQFGRQCRKRTELSGDFHMCRGPALKTGFGEQRWRLHLQVTVIVLTMTIIVLTMTVIVLTMTVIVLTMASPSAGLSQR